MLKLGHFGKEIRSTCKVLKCGAGEGWRLVWLIVWEMKKYYRVKEERNIIHTIKRRKADFIGHILLRNCLLKHYWRQYRRRDKVTGRQGRRRKQLLDALKKNGKILKSETGSTRSPSVENWLWKTLWTTTESLKKPSRSLFQLTPTTKIHGGVCRLNIYHPKNIKSNLHSVFFCSRIQQKIIRLKSNQVFF
jgi:hypothetical protein